MLKERLGGSIQDNDTWLKELFNVITDQVSTGERVELRGFGTFESREIKAHTTVLPATGEEMANPRSFTVDFRPSQRFKDHLRTAGEKT